MKDAPLSQGCPLQCVYLIQRNNLLEECKRPAKSGVSSIRGQVVPSYAEAIRRSYRPAVLAAA